MAVALGFSAFGVAMVVHGGPFAVVFGLFTVVFFGGGMARAMLTAARRRFVTLTLTPQGIEVNGGIVPWEDVEAVGVGDVSTKLFGIRLTRYDRYVASMTPAARAEIERSMRWFWRPVAAVGGLLGGAGLTKFARTASSLERGLRWSRTTSGWDLTFSPAMLDRRLAKFVAFVEDYRRRVHDEREAASPDV
ncbi:hypothetical protein ACN3XK_70845 [Actinomadura welshii]